MTDKQVNELYQTVYHNEVEQFEILFKSYVKKPKDIEIVKEWLRQMNYRKELFAIVNSRELNIKRLNKLKRFE
jgi:pyridoxal/pyridoxine/pyridoxamine kinase